MEALNPEWVEAGARALTETWLADADDDNEALAAAVIAAVEPLIRADERERHHDGGDCECTSVYADGTWLHASRNEANIRAQIAAEIEALPCMDPLDWHQHSCAISRDDAARIARGTP